MRLRVAGVAVLACILLTIGLVDSAVNAIPVARTGATKASLQGPQALLQQRDEALQRGDKAAYVGVLDERADAEFRARMLQRYEGLQSLAFATFSSRVQSETSGDLAPGLQLAKKYRADDAVLVETRETYQLADYDSRDAWVTSWLTYVRRGDRWTIAADNDARVFGLVGDAALWDGGRLAVSKRPNVLLLAAPEVESEAQRIGALAERAVALSPRILAWSQRIPVVIPRSSEVASQLVGGRDDLGNFGALTTYRPDRSKNWEPSAPRVIVQHEALVGADDAAILSLLRHELVHAAVVTQAGPHTPHWLDEGLATAFSRDLQNALVPTTPRGDHNLAAVRMELPRAEEFFAADSQEMSSAYERSASFVGWMRGQFGDARVLEFYRDLGSRRVVVGPSTVVVRLAFAEQFGLPLDDAVLHWSDSLRTQSVAER